MEFVVLGVVVLVILFILFLFFAVDYGMAKAYKNAKDGSAVVKKALGKDFLHEYICEFGEKHRRRYHLYEVEYEAGGTIRQGVWWSKQKGIPVGTTVQIKYDWNDEKQQWEVMSRAFGDRLKEHAIGGGLGLLLALVLIYMKNRGII